MIAVFDIGNVLVKWDPDFLARQIIPDAARAEKFRNSACNGDFLLSFDLSDDCAAAARRRAALYPEFTEELHAFNARWQEAVRGPIEENVAILRGLRAQGAPVYAITNFAADKFEQSRSIYPFFDDFTIAVVSGREKIAKPDPAIYRTLFARSGKSPQELLFIDDSAANIAAAKALGMAAVHFVDGVDLAVELRKAGLKV